MSRSHSCWSCIHCGRAERGPLFYRPERVMCNVTKRMGKLDRGYYCKHFSYMQRHNEIGDDGIPVKNRQPLDYRTKRQWAFEKKKN